MRRFVRPVFCFLGVALVPALWSQTIVSFLEGRTAVGGSATAIVAVDFNRDAHIDAAIVDPSDGLTILLDDSHGNLKPVQTLPVYASSIASADFNGDGIPDLAVPGAVLLGNGDGTFQNAIYFGKGGLFVATGDFNGDGYADVAVGVPAVLGGIQAVQVFLGDGRGDFKTALETELRYSGSAMAAWDFNGDGIADLAVATSDTSTSSGYLEVLLGNRDTVFSTSQIPLGSAGSQPNALVLADFNGDGAVDVAVGDYRIQKISVLPGDGKGNFGTPVVTGAPLYIDSLAVADLNGDGIPDLVAGTNTAEAAVFYGKGDGSFQFEQQVVTGFRSSQIALAKLTRAGGVDLLSANAAGSVRAGELLQSALSVIPGRNGRFQASDSYAAGAVPSGLAYADFNGDGHLDLAVTSTNLVSIMLGDGKGHLGTRRKIKMPGAQQVAAADINGDGKIDLVVVSAKSINTLFGNGDGTFGAPVSTPCSGCDRAFPLLLADVNHDGKLDAIIQGVFGLLICLGKGDGTFQPPTIPQAATAGYGSGVTLAVAPLTGSGNLDLIYSEPPGRHRSGGISIDFGHGDGTFSNRVPLTQDGFDAVVADFNGDGKLDIAAIYPPTNAVEIFMGHGDGSFDAPFLIAINEAAGPLIAADFNGDGHVDLIAGSTPSGYSGSGLVLLGKGDGTFTAQRQSILLTNGYPAPLVVAADFNGDGKPDLLTLAGTDSIWLLVNTTH